MVRIVERRRVGTVLAVTALLSAACAAGDATVGPPIDPVPIPPQDRVELVVFAASTFVDAFEELAEMFVAEGGPRVVLNHAGSQTLAMQIVAGAPADVFVAADAAQMAVVASAGLLVGDAVTVATNGLAIAVELGNPRGVRGLTDLARPDLLVVLPAAEVPAGRHAAAVLARQGIEVRPASLEPSVRAALGRVAQGEADAAVVFASDVAASDRVDAVRIPDEQNVVATHPAAVLRGGSAQEAAVAFVALLRSERGRAVLAAHGFGAP